MDSALSKCASQMLLQSYTGQFALPCAFKRHMTDLHEDDISV